MFSFEPIRNFYGRFERPISSLSLIAGFVFDAITLKRVDMFWENFWIIAHLVIVGTFITLIHLREVEAGGEAVDFLQRIFFADFDVGQELGKTGPATGELGERFAAGFHDAQDLQGGDEAVAGGAVVAQDDMAALFSTHVEIVLEHFRQDVLVAHGGA